MPTSKRALILLGAIFLGATAFDGTGAAAQGLGTPMRRAPVAVPDRRPIGVGPAPAYRRAAPSTSAITPAAWKQDASRIGGSVKVEQIGRQAVTQTAVTAWRSSPLWLRK